MSRAYRYVQHRFVEYPHTTLYPACFMTVVEITTHGWWLWKRVTERQVELFRERYSDVWRDMSVGVEYNFWTCELFDGLLRAAKARDEYEELLDAEIAAADDKVVPIRKKR